MAVNFLDEIYVKAELITIIKEIVINIRKKGIDEIIVADINNIINKITELCEEYLALDASGGNELWCKLQKLTKSTYLLQIADIFEMDIIPIIYKYIDVKGKIEVEDDRGRILSSSKSGFLTIKMENGRFIHSCMDPMWEAREQAVNIYKPNMHEVSLLGVGLGYLAYQLYLISEGTLKINIFERDEKLISYASEYGVIDWIPDDNIRFINSTDIVDFLGSIKEGEGFEIFEPLIYQYSESDRFILKDICATTKTITQYEKSSEINLWQNINNVDKTFKDFCKPSHKKIMIVAAGPSLDDTIKFIKDNRNETFVIAVGTVLKKLVNLGILPNAVAVLDPNRNIVKQFEGMENLKVPLFIDICANYGVGTMYTGDKYLTFSDCFLNVVKQQAEKYGEIIFDYTGTVTSMALAVAIAFGPDEIYLAGVDLAFPYNKSHASDTLEYREEVSASLETESVGGGRVATDVVFLDYLKQIEGQISRCNNITFFNLSKIGAKIKGTKEI